MLKTWMERKGREDTAWVMGCARVCASSACLQPRSGLGSTVPIERHVVTEGEKEDMLPQMFIYGTRETYYGGVRSFGITLAVRIWGTIAVN